MTHCVKRLVTYLYFETESQINWLYFLVFDLGESDQQRLLGGLKGSGMQIAARKQSELCLFSVVKAH